MKERPILFSGPMVRAILDGRKTQTRRVLKPQPYIDSKWGMVWEPKGKNHPTGSPWYCERNANWQPITNAFEDFWSDKGGSPYGKPGGRLWVKETWKPDPSWGQSSSPTMEIQEGSNILYRSTLPEGHAKHEFGKWRPSIFMRRWMSRITLEITAVRVERLQDITESDAIAEGIKKVKCGLHEECYEWSRNEDGEDTATDAYKTLWESINGKGSWEQNPWVWVIEFKKL